MIKLFILIIALYAPYVLSSQSFGLETTTGEPLELLKLETQVQVEGESYARIQYTFLYKNSFDNTIQNKFVFPPTRNAIFHKFEVIIRNQTLTTKVVGWPITKDLETHNNCGLGFPMMPPNETVHIVFVMIQPLGVILGRFYELKLPAFINNDTYLNPWNIQIELESTDEFVVLSNPTHHLVPEISSSETGEGDRKYRLFKAFWNVTVAPNKDFAVYFGSENLKNHTIRIAGANMRLYNFVPNLEYMSAQHAQNMLENTTDALFQMKKLTVQSSIQKSKMTCFFVLDRGDSMKGSPIQLLKKILKALLHELAPYCRDFHIVSFGSTFDHYNSAQSLSGLEDIQETVKWVDTIEADMGGSDLLKALKYIDGLPGNNKIKIILTDGDTSEPYRVKWPDYFIVGIGEASKGLIKELNYNWIGGAEFVVDSQDFGEQEVFNILHKLNPIYLECAFTFSTDDSDYYNQPFYNSSRYWVPFSKDDASYLEYFSSDTNLKTCDGHTYWDHCQHGLTSHFTREATLFELHTKNATGIWRTLASVVKINELEDVLECWEYSDDDPVEIYKRRIDFSVKYQVLSPYTSLVLQANVCNTDYVEFFDRSKFNRTPYPSQDESIIFDDDYIPEDYTPFNSIQYAQKHPNDAVSSQIKSIDL